METEANPSPLTSIPDDWDYPITEEELEAIDDAIRSASSSSSSTASHDGSDPCSKHRRRLPGSLASSVIRCSHSFTLSPCPKNRPFDFVHSSRQENLKFKNPTMSFGGRIVYSRTVTEVEKATRQLLDGMAAKEREMGQVIFGFDIEWRPTFKKGVPPGKAAVMQICGDASHCYVMHIIHSGIPQKLQSLLEDPKFTKVGVGIANDSMKIFKDYNLSIKALEDLSCLANQKIGGDPKKWGLESLTEAIICKQLHKPNKIRLGNWEADFLSKEQLQYAATDAYASWYLYQLLQNLPDAANNEV
ncbi:3'-5' exonuclease isoform X2 [Malania oleifera]|uniref:3'-5' exonuclease isoform X2 n=1 Tax=Malania oleifera TaxID=397392 RepID=UPI0025ADEF91|nr:3'-5' exonuclease isoform X2 [Malania oleifera]